MTQDLMSQPSVLSGRAGPQPFMVPHVQGGGLIIQFSTPVPLQPRVHVVRGFPPHEALHQGYFAKQPALTFYTPEGLSLTFNELNYYCHRKEPAPDY